MKSTRIRILTVLCAAIAGFAAFSLFFSEVPPAAAHTRITTDVTWSETIRPIFIQKCMPCHHPGGLAPDYVDLTIYGTDVKPGARAWAAQIEDEIMLGRMPPWNPDERFGQFENSRALTNDEKEMIIAWIRGGGPQGPYRNLPPPEEFAEPTWTLGQPAMIVGLPQGHVVPKDKVYDTAEAVIAIAVEEDTYITGYEFLVGNPQNVARVTAWLHDPEGFEPQPIEMEVKGEYDPYATEKERELTRMRPMPRGPHFLGQWVKGDGPVMYPQTAGRKLYKGSSVELRIDYVRPEWSDWSQEIRDNTKLGLFLAAPAEEFDLLVESVLAQAPAFTVKAKESIEKKTEYVFPENTHLLAVEPHLGPIATRLKLEMFYPDGIQRTLVWVPKYQQRWATSYRFAEPVAAPKDARLVFTGYVDNTEENQSNPNSPPKDIKSGPGYLDERQYMYLHYTLDDHLKLTPIVVTKETPQGGGMLGGLGDEIVDALGGGRTVEESTKAVAETIDAPQEPERIRIAANGYHQVQGTMPRPGAFALYVYDDQMAPIDPRNFVGELLFDGGARTVPLTHFLPGHDHLSAWIEPAFPQTFEAKILLGSEEERFAFTFEAPISPASAQDDAAAKPGFVQPPHGGWLEAIDGTAYQVEAALPAPGDLRLYFYGPNLKPLDPRGFRAEVEVLGAGAQGSAGTLVASTPPSQRAEYLGAKISSQLPLKTRVTLAIGAGRQFFDFEFDELSEEPWDLTGDSPATRPVVLGPHGSPELYPSADGFHFVEAALPQPGELRLYFYDAWKQPVEPGLFGAEIEMGGKTQPMVLDPKSPDSLAAYLAPRTPLEVNAGVWIGGKREAFTFRFDGVTIDPAAALNTANCHMDHSPIHGGQFFMADNMFHHVEGTMPSPGEFRFYFYDDCRLPIDPRNFTGTARIEHLNESTGEVTEDVYELQLVRPGAEYLMAVVPPQMPSTLYALVKLGGVDKRFDFQFDQVTIDTGPRVPVGMQTMLGMAPGAAPGAPGMPGMHSHFRPPLTIPGTVEEILGMIDLKVDDLRGRIAAKDWYALYQPALDIGDLVSALTTLDSGVDPRQKGKLKILRGTVSRTVNKMDRAGDTGDEPRVQAAFQELSANVREVKALFPPKKQP